jgi:hypothetical protein
MKCLHQKTWSSQARLPLGPRFPWSLRFAWRLAHQGFVSSSQLQKRYQVKKSTTSPRLRTPNFTQLPHTSSNSLRIDNGTQTQCPRTHTLLDRYDPIVHRSWFRPFTTIKSFPQIEQQSEPAANCIRNMAELLGYDAAEDEAD